MTAKQYVLSIYSKAVAERQTIGRVKGFQKIQWVIRQDRNAMYMATGTSERAAWVNARTKIQNNTPKSIPATVGREMA